uniref:General transcription factor 3C polypeptide 3 n=1 Tax=Cacopsylla melanoneura TaxID=428564 RepID=A0A8D9E085_9HEMI
MPIANPLVNAWTVTPLQPVVNHLSVCQVPILVSKDHSLHCLLTRSHIVFSSRIFSLNNMAENTDGINYQVIEEIVSLEDAMEVDLALDYEELEQVSEEKSLQQKYVSGEISFTEYSSQLGALYENLEEAEDPLEEVEEITVGPDDLLEDDQSSTDSIESPGSPSTRKGNKGITIGVGKKKSRVKRQRPRVKLPNALKGMLGEATIMFLKKENRQKAIEMVLEVVRQSPNASEAYKTLATMYEEVGDLATSIKMLLIGAHLSSDNAEEWIRLGTHFEKIGDIKQAITCFSKALKQDVSRIDIHDRRLRLCEEIDMKNRGFILVGYQRYLKNLNSESDPFTVLEISTRAAHLCHTARNFTQAAAALDTAFKFAPHHVGPDHVNLYLEVLLELGRYATCVRVLTEFAHIGMDYVVLRDPSSGEPPVAHSSSTPSDEPPSYETNLQVTGFTLPSDPPRPEILSKLVITLVHLKCEPLFLRLLDSLEFDVEVYGDLYLDITEALIREKYFSSTVQLLKRLIESEKYNQPGVWKQLAESYENMGNMAECKIAYHRLLEQVPLNVDVRRHLSELYMKEDNTQEALRVLRQTDIQSYTPSTESRNSLVPPHSNIIKHEATDPLAPVKYKPKRKKGALDPGALPMKRDDGAVEAVVPSAATELISAPLLVEQLTLMMNTGQSIVDPGEYFDVMNLLLSQQSIQVQNPSEAKILFTRSRTMKKSEMIATQRGISKDTILDNRARFTSEPTPSFTSVNTLYRHSLEIARLTNDYQPLQRIILQVFGSFLLMNENTAYTDQLTLDACIILFNTNNIEYCYQLFRHLLFKFTNSKIALNLMNMITLKNYDTRTIRNTLRLFQANPNNFGLNVIYANNCNLTSNYKYCINEYAILSRSVDHKEPLYLLLLAVSYTNISCARFMDKKAFLVSHALAWIFKYKTVRGQPIYQEVYYNIGRLYHQVGLLSQAVSFYKRALSSPPLLPQYNLQSEIAYNLHLVYLSSGNRNLALHTLNTYLVV